MTPAIAALLEALRAALPALLGEGLEIEIRVRVGKPDCEKSQTDKGGEK